MPVRTRLGRRITTMELARWTNRDEYDAAHRDMAARGLIQTGCYGGIGPFGGSEVGVFEKADPCKPWQIDELRRWLT